MRRHRKVESYAAKAPDADLVVVLSNSTKYGGAGYTLTSQVGYDGIATASSDHADSDQVAVHETGHSLGKLADEYFYADYGTYTGAEPGESNATKLTAAQLTAQQKQVVPLESARPRPTAARSARTRAGATTPRASTAPPRTRSCAPSAASSASPAARR